MRYLAHIAIIKGEPAWTGFDACGDFARDTPSKLYLLGNGQAKFEQFSPSALITAARAGMFGFAIEFEAERDSRRADKARRARPKDRRQRSIKPSPRGALPMLTFAAFSEINRRRCESALGFAHDLDSWSASDWMTAVAGELGEAANVVKKLNRVRDGIPGNKRSPEQLRADLKTEIGDAFIYLDLFAQSQGFTIEQAVREAFNRKSEEIGCPTFRC